MGRNKRPNYSSENLLQLVRLCNQLDLVLDKVSDDQYRVYGATHVIDIWVARMVYHRISGEDIRAVEPYSHDLDWKFNKEQVKQLLLTGKVD